MTGERVYKVRHKKTGKWLLCFGYGGRDSWVFAGGKIYKRPFDLLDRRKYCELIEFTLSDPRVVSE